MPQQPLTPQQAASQVLAAVGPTTTVRVDSNVTVAGQAAYALVLAPKDARSLVGQVQIDVDGSNGVPLRLQVFARGASSPAFQVGYTDIHFVRPAPPTSRFSPPPGATVTQVNLSGGKPGGAKDHASARCHHDRIRLADRARAAVGRPDARALARRRRQVGPVTSAAVLRDLLARGHAGARHLGQRQAAADQPGLGADDRSGHARSSARSSPASCTPPRRPTPH